MTRFKAVPFSRPARAAPSGPHARTPSIEASGAGGKMRRRPYNRFPAPPDAMFDTLTARLSRTHRDPARPRPHHRGERRGERCARRASRCSRRTWRCRWSRASSRRSRSKALGAEVLASLTPGQAFIGILHDELVALMGGAGAGFKLRASRRWWCCSPAFRAPARPRPPPSSRAWLIEREQQARAARQHRRAPTGRDAAARAPRRPGAGAEYFPAPRRAGAGRHRARRARRGAAAACSTC